MRQGGKKTSQCISFCYFLNFESLPIQKDLKMKQVEKGMTAPPNVWPWC